MAPQSGNMVQGAVLQCLEAATLGMPFEVWKTRMGRNRHETTIEAFKNVYKSGGAQAFWKGTSAKMVESATKGCILLYAKESILASLNKTGTSPGIAGALAGAGGGICQVSVMGPCTFLVTAVVTQKNATVGQFMKQTWAEQGIKGFYPGGSAIAMRQASNWASRQGFTEFVRNQMRNAFHGGDKKAKLTNRQEIYSGIIGGIMACWNHPFEVARIEMQASAAAGEAKVNMVTTLRNIHSTNGTQGLFQGVIPRVGLGIWQTLFMVIAPKLIANYMEKK
uniref:Mitochondrial carrier protein n=2 Tax=Eutreptiella gymnastica TaxID=73025 RepID=A0A7S1J7M5_9EUGL